MNVQNEVILLLGKTGAGKSTLGNRLLGSHDNKPFTASSSLESQTKTCEVATLSINGKKYDLVDTPGLFDNQGVDPLKEIKEFVNKCAGGVRAILLVLGAGRITDEEKNALGTIQKFLGKDATDNFIVVFSKAEPEQVMDKQQIDWKKIPILRDFIEQKINGRWCVAPMRRYYNEDERKANENRLMEIKEYISRIQVLYTTKQFEENQKRLKEEQRKKKEDDERRKREYEDKIRAEAKEKMRQEMEEKARQEREKLRRDLEENARREREKMRLDMEENARKLRREMEEKAKPVYITRTEYRYRDTERKNEGTEKKVTNKVANVPKKENASNVAVVSKREENNIVANPSKKEDTRKVANASKREDTSKVVNAPDFSEELAAIGVTTAMGAGAGSVVPGVGTALGAATGAVIGTLAAIPCVISKLASN